MEFVKDNCTCLERLEREHPEMLDPLAKGGALGCPHDYGYALLPNCVEIGCVKCWQREART